MVEEVKKKFEPNKDTIVYLMYLLYKSNLITRLNIRHMFKIIDEEIPGDVLAYLVTEERKAA
jgi:hypothetical protein